METEHILAIQVFQVLFLGGITIGYHSLNLDNSTIQKCLLQIARFTTCLLLSQVLELACSTLYTVLQAKSLPELKWSDKYRNSLYVLASSIGVLMYNNHSILEVEVVLLMIACCVVRYLEAKRRSATITYGEGMACSFSEGYLYQVIPSDGAKFFGLEDHIRAVEASQRVIFPVRALLIVITKSLYCPPNLEDFNKNDDTLPRLEACRSLPDVQRNVAGVKDRVYRNTVYKLRRHPADARPVYVVAECATPLNTLWRVLQKSAVYQRLAAADGAAIAAQFCNTLRRIVDNSPELRGKCELVHYDDTNPQENLAEVLLAKVRELEPNYENITRDQ